MVLAVWMASKTPRPHQSTTTPCRSRSFIIVSTDGGGPDLPGDAPPYKLGPGHAEVLRPGVDRGQHAGSEAGGDLRRTSGGVWGDEEGHHFHPAQLFGPFRGAQLGT